MPRARILGTPTLDLATDDEPRTGRAEGGDVNPKDCLLCTLVDEAHDEVDDQADELDDDEIDDVLRDKLADAVAFGALVLSRSDTGIATCSDCHEAIESALADLRRDLRDLHRRDVRRQRPARTREGRRRD